MFKTLGICALLLGLGYYTLENLSAREKVFLGNTFYIILGCVLIAVPGLVVIVTLRNYFFPKKKRRSRSKPVFLNEEDVKKNKKTEP